MRFVRRPPATDAPAALDALLVDGGIRAIYQPIVRFGDGAVVAYEALARGPENSRLESPAALFAAAREADRLDELDWACRAAAIEGALDAGLPDSVSLCINVHPAAAAAPCPEGLQATVDRGLATLQLVAELPEPALRARPVALLDAADGLREAGWRIALDDAGADVDGLAMLPLLAPELVKLDLALLAEHDPGHVAAVARGAARQVERGNAQVVAEGVEIAPHVALAHELGALLGQGWHLGVPGPLG